MRSAAIALVALAVAAAAAPAAAQPTTEYVVKRGDTCVGIAARELGDRSAYTAIHRLNPRLGRMPHMLKPGQVLRLPPVQAPPPDWEPGLAHHVPALVGAGVDGGGTVRAAWYPAAGAGGYRLEVQRTGGGTVLVTDLPGSASRLELRAVPPGHYRATLSSVTAGHVGPAGDAFEVTVVPVPVAMPGAAPATEPALSDPARPLAPPTDAGAPATPPLLAVGAAVGDRGLACEAHGREGAPLTLVSAGPATLVCSTADGVTLEPFAVEIAPVTAEAFGEGGPLTVGRGESAVLELVLHTPALLGDHWRVTAGPGLKVTSVEAADSGEGDDRSRSPEASLPGRRVLRIGVTAVARAAQLSSVTILDGTTGARVAVVDVTVRDTEPASGRDPLHMRPGHRHVTVGAYAGWISFPRGMIEGSELGDPALDAYQVASGAGAGMRVAWWPARDIFLEADAGLVPTGFVAADEPAWIAGGHLFAGVAAVDGPRWGLRGVLGAGGYALLGDAAYARADLDADVAYGLTATLRLSRDYALRLDGRHHIAPDRGDGGVTDVLEATLGIEAVLARTRPH